MSLQKDSLARVAVVCAIASAEAGLGYGLFESVNNKDQWQWCTPVFFGSVILVLCTVVFAFPKRQQKYGFILVAILTGTVWLFFSTHSGAWRGEICAAYSSVVSQMNS